MTATTTILTALRASGLPVEAQAFLAAIGEGEGAIDFNTLYSGGTLDNPADAASIQMEGNLREWTGPLTAFPAWSGAKLLSGLISTAAGVGQVTRTTYNDYASSFGISDFQPSSQISFCWQLAQKRFGAPVGLNLLQVLQAKEATMIPSYLYKTWPGGADSGFPMRYADNFAALQAPPPAPTPETTTYQLTLTAEDGTEQSGTLTLAKKVMATTATVLVAAGLMGSSPAPSAAAHPRTAFAHPIQVGGAVALPPSFCGDR